MRGRLTLVSLLSQWAQACYRGNGSSDCFCCPWVGTPKSSIEVVKYLREYPFKFILRFTYNFSKVAFRQRTGRSWRQWPGSCTTRVQPQDTPALAPVGMADARGPFPETDPLPFAWREAECCPEKTGLKCIFCPECEVFLLFFPRHFGGERRKTAEGP